MALVVVDMQQNFPCSTLTVDRVCERIREAKALEQVVFNVLFAGYGRTKARVGAELRDAKRINVRKKDTDGGWELSLALIRAGFLWPEQDLNFLQFCGIYEDQCVLDTALKTAELEPGRSIQILRDSCQRHYVDDFVVMEKLPKNLALIGKGRRWEDEGGEPFDYSVEGFI